jgi:L-threonate 2-dehydrogenase
MARVGIVGLGIMGSAIARHVLDGGHTLVGHDIRTEGVEELCRVGGTPLDSAREVAEAADVVITSLPSSAAALDVCAALAAGARKGLVVVETSTLPHEVKDRCRELVGDAGADLLDCPLSGTGAQAQVRDVVVFGSGDEPAFERARPVLESFSRSVRYVGPFGSGSTMKLVANLLVAVHNAIRDGAGNSVIFEKRGQLMVDRAYLPPTAKISMFVKDTGLIHDFADPLGLDLPMLEATRPLYDRAVRRGLGDADAAALLETMRPARGPKHEEHAE